MQRINWGNILKFGILALYVSSVSNYIRIGIGPTFMWWLIHSIISLSLIRLWDKSNHPMPLMVWMGVVLVSCVYGSFYCRDYWDWKLLVGNGISYSICVAALGFSSPEVLSKSLHFLYKHIWKLFVVIAFLVSSTGIAKLLIPFAFLLLFYSLLDSKNRWYVIVAIILLLVSGTDSRMTLLRFGFCLIAGIFFVRHNMQRIIERWYWLFFALPFVLFTLAATESFNIFDVGKDMLETDETPRNVDLSDTRTMLYEEVISTVLESNTLLFGVTPARGYNSRWVIRNQDKSDVMGETHYGVRAKTECSVLNVFLHYGILGILIYMLLFWRASYLAIFKSNNRYIPVLGLYVAFSFMTGWLGDNTRYDINMFFIWATIGMCYSPSFREMTDDEFCEWLDETTA